jgi:uncharacterized protein (TIGR03663 family)
MEQEQLREEQSALQYFTSPQWLMFFLFLAGGLLLRWYQLDERPLHHDESLHVMYGKYYYDNPTQGYYRYDPMLHGPLLYSILMFAYNSLGVSEWAARFPIALMGSAYILLPFVFRRFFSPIILLAMTAFVAFSPTLIYWSRFLREDFCVMTGIFFSLYGLFIAPPKRKALWFFLGIALHLASKENIFVHAALILGFYLFQDLVVAGKGLLENLSGRALRHPDDITVGQAITKLLIVAIWVGITAWYAYSLSHTFSAERAPNKPGDPGEWLAVLTNWYLWIVSIPFLTIYSFIGTRPDRGVQKYFRQYLPEVLLGLFAGVFVFCFFYSAAFQYWRGVTDILIGEPLKYWLHQHGIERIKGPFLFHFYTLSWYESLFIIFAFVQAGLFYRRAHWGIQSAGAGIALLSLCLYIVFFGMDEGALNQNRIWDFFNAKDALDVFSIPILVFHPVLITLQHLLRRETALAASGYAFTASFFSYSYLGEKVPWLSMYPLIAGIIYFALYFDDYFRRYPVKNWRSFPVGVVLSVVGLLTISLATFFAVQEGWSKVQVAIVVRPLLSFFQGLDGNSVLLVSGVILAILGGIDLFCRSAGREGGILGNVNLLRATLVVALIFNIRAALLTNFVYGGDASAYLSQVHTTREIRDIAVEIRKEIETEKRGYRPHVYVEGEPVWPLTWYFRDMPEYKWDATSTPQERDTYLYRLKTWQEGENPPPGYRARRVNLRGWWVPDFNQMTLKKLLAYALNQRAWTPVGYSYTTFWIRESEEPR